MMLQVEQLEKEVAELQKALANKKEHEAALLKVFIFFSHLLPSEKALDFVSFRYEPLVTWKISICERF